MCAQTVEPSGIVVTSIDTETDVVLLVFGTVVSIFFTTTAGASANEVSRSSTRSRLPAGSGSPVADTIANCRVMMATRARLTLARERSGYLASGIGMESTKSAVAAASFLVSASRTPASTGSKIVADPPANLR
jgi:hypothetical protein